MNAIKKWIKAYGPPIVNFLVCFGLYVAVLVIYVKKYTIAGPFNSEQNFWDVIHAEFPNLLTIIPFVCPLVSFWLIGKIRPDYSKLGRIIWSLILAVLVCIYRFLVDLDVHPVLFAISGFTQYIVCLIVVLALDIGHQRSVKVQKGILDRVLGSAIKNQNILSVQLLECEKSNSQQDIETFQIKSISAVANRRSDNINSILKLQLQLPKNDYNKFCVSYTTYMTMVENGADQDAKVQFKDNIEEIKKDLIKRINQKPLDQLENADACLARLLVCYTLLEQMAEEPAQAVADFADGTTGLTIEHEKRLFTILRTGILGAILFENQRYYFSYRRDGIKSGRKYCAFVLNFENEELVKPDNLLICLIAIRENSTGQVSSDIIEWIERTDKKIVAAYLKEIEGD